MFVQFPTSDGPIWIAVAKIVSVRPGNRDKSVSIVQTETKEFPIKKEVEEVVRILEEKVRLKGA